MSINRRQGFEDRPSKDYGSRGPRVYRKLCPVCGQENRLGRSHEHKDCFKEIERRLEQKGKP